MTQEDQRKQWFDSDARIAFLLYIAIALIIFLPLIINFGGSTLAPTINTPSVIAQSRDRFHFMWNFWWTRTALASGQNVLFTHLMFAPGGASLALQTVDFADALISAPVAFLGGNVAAYNFVIIFAFVLSGFFMFLLARYLTRSWIAGFGAGLIFSYFPQHVSQAMFGHPNFISIEWIPAFLFALILAFETGKILYGVIAGIFLALVTYTELELLIMSVLVGILYLIFMLVKSRFKIKPLGHYLKISAIMAAVWFAISGIYLIAAYLSAANQARAAPPISQIFANAAKPIMYLTPPPQSFLYGQLFASNYSPLSQFLEFPNSGGAAQWILFVGYVTLALALVGAILSKDSRRYYFIVLVAVAFIISLGPSPSSQLSIQTPYTFLLKHFPILEYFRTDSRFSILVMLGLAALAGLGIKAILDLVSPVGKAVKSNRGIIVGFVILALILLEFAPVIATQGIYSDPYYGVIASDKSQFLVLELPASITVTDNALFAQIQYDKPLVDGKISQISTVLPEYMYIQPFLRILANGTLAALKLSNSERIIDYNYSQIQLAPVVLSYYKIKYVIVEYNQITSPNEYNILTRTLGEGVGAAVYHDQNILAYEQTQWLTPSEIQNMTQANGSIVLFGSGWSLGQNGTAEALNSAQLVVYAPVASTYSVNFDLSSSNRICLKNLNSSTSETCPTDPSQQITDRVLLDAGMNILNLSFPSGSALVRSINVTA